MNNNITVSMPIERYDELINIEVNYNIIMDAVKKVGLDQKDARLFINYLKLENFDQIDADFNLARRVVIKENKENA